jgi:hypothetical protein
MRPTRRSPRPQASALPYSREGSIDFGSKIRRIGADRRQVLWLVMRQDLVLGTMGVDLRLVGTAIASRGLVSLLYGLSALDLLTLTIVSMFLLAVALEASAIPAHRAFHIAARER